VSLRRIPPPIAILAALVLGALTLVVVELAKGAAGPVSPVSARPCEPRAPFEGGGVSGVVQRVVLEGLDGAACRLGTTREELVLSLSPSSSGSRRWDRHTIEVAIRAGLNRAIDEEQRRGSIPGFLVPLLHRIVDETPLDKLIEGGISLGGLLP
jgi:hypothetical protein